MIVEQMLKNAQTPLLHIADVSGSALFQGDCLDIMPLIPDKSVQLILADLPYGTTKLGWDSVIDTVELWNEYNRIIKQNGTIVLFSIQPFTTKLINSNIENFKYTLVWEKTIASNFIRAEKEPLKLHEDICVFSNGVIEYNYLLEDKDRKNIRNTISENIANYKEGHQFYGRGVQKYNEKRKIPTDKKYSGSLLKYTSVGNNNPNRFHPTQKPIDLLKRLITHYSNENNMVLDNTMGSGTTCLAAKELNRKFIGIEKESKYYEIARQRCGF